MDGKVLCGRPAHQREQLVSLLRDNIVKGYWKPGCKLPSRSRFSRDNGCSTQTLQSAIDVLREDGFVVTHGPAGTFVADHPPHLAQFGVVFRDDPFGSAQTGSYFRRPLVRGLNLLPDRADRRTRSYRNMADGKQSADLASLVEDVQANRLAGLIFFGPPFELRGTPVLDKPDLPRIAVMMPSADFVDLPVVYPNLLSFVEETLRYCQRRGWRRVGFIGRGGFGLGIDESIETTARALGLLVRPHWIQHPAIPHTGSSEPAYRLLRLLFKDPADRPEVLVLQDDNIVPEVTAALKRVMAELDVTVRVIAHANHPHVTHSAVPAVRIGFDTRDLIDRCVHHLQAMKRGAPVPFATFLPAKVFGEEPDFQSLLDMFSQP